MYKPIDSPAPHLERNLRKFSTGLGLFGLFAAVSSFIIIPVIPPEQVSLEWFFTGVGCGAFGSAMLIRFYIAYSHHVLD